jgi:hypothetical protein
VESPTRTITSSASAIRQKSVSRSWNPDASRARILSERLIFPCAATRAAGIAA